MLRDSLGFKTERLDDKELAGLAGVSKSVLGDQAASDPPPPFSFVFRGEGPAKLVLKSPLAVNRRFALARLIGDKLLSKKEEGLLPALYSRSHRQKRQRAFAAEFLCPYEEMKERLALDFSDDNQERVATEFAVSSMVVRTQLVKKGDLEPETLESF
jgi:hypothetical protein